jgi:hypothetical protein
MSLHGRDVGRQLTRAATSTDGLHFTGLAEDLGAPYFRVVKYQDYYYALAMPGIVYRSRDGLTHFEQGPTLFNPDMRHSALLIRDDTLHVFWTQAGHAPERILHSSIDLREDWMQWRQSEQSEVLRPQLPFEGSELPVATSQRGHIDERVNQLRDPAIFEENGDLYLLYAYAGESGIAIVRLIGPN